VKRFWSRLRPTDSRRNADTSQSDAVITASLPELMVQADRIARSLAAGAHGRRMAGSGEDFWQYRAAQPGEPASHIDWRQSARSDQLWVREREAESPQHVSLWCDPSASMHWRSSPHLPTKRERALVCALALGSALLRGHERVGLIAGHEPGHGFSGQAAFPRLAHALEAAPSPEDWPEPELIRIHGQVILVSDFLWPDDQIERVLQSIAARPARAHLLCVLDPAETTLPFGGRIRFTSLENEAPLTLPAVETLRDDYSTQLAAHLDRLRNACTRHRADFALHVTDHNPLPTLLALHNRLAHAHA